MRNSVLLIVLGVGVSSCTDRGEAAAAAEAPTPSAEQKAAPEQKADAETPTEPKPEAGDPTKAEKDGESSTGKGGLAGITKDLIDQARVVATEPVRLIPDSAMFVMQMDPPPVLAHSEGKALWQKLEDSDADFKKAMDVMRACLGRLDVVERIAVGFDADDERLAIVARGKGLGTEDVWRCFDKETRSRGEDFDLAITGIARGKGPQLRESDEPLNEADQGYFVDDDTFVLVSREWDDQVRALVDGKGTPAVDGRLRSTAGRVAPESTLWVAGRIEGKAKSGLSGAVRDVQDVAFSLNIEDEAAVTHTSANAGTSDKATAIREELQKGFEEIKGMLPMLGVPSSLSSKIEFKSEGDIVSLDLTVTKSEMESIRTSISGMM